MTKIYGISKVIEHPAGFSYICAYLCSRKDLGNSMALLMWRTDSGEIMGGDYVELWTELVGGVGR